jgi:hypothetical protein
MARQADNPMTTQNTQTPPESALSEPAGSAIPLPKTPPDALLHSMAIRYDHGLAIPGHYDTQPDTDGGEHERRYQATITTMRQLYEEVSGHGFYEWPNAKGLPPVDEPPNTVEL